MIQVLFNFVIKDTCIAAGYSQDHCRYVGGCSHCENTGVSAGQCDALEFKLSCDPLIVNTARDIVGLYLDPPLKAMVLCVDEKRRIQPLNRT